MSFRGRGNNRGRGRGSFNAPQGPPDTVVGNYWQLLAIVFFKKFIIKGNYELQ